MTGSSLNDHHGGTNFAFDLFFGSTDQAGMDLTFDIAVQVLVIPFFFLFFGKFLYTGLIPSFAQARLRAAKALWSTKS
jgi:hypothetical protein